MKQMVQLSIQIFNGSSILNGIIPTIIIVQVQITLMVDVTIRRNHRTILDLNAYETVLF
jgi:hypothetical protein